MLSILAHYDFETKFKSLVFKEQWIPIALMGIATKILSKILETETLNIYKKGYLMIMFYLYQECKIL